MVSSPERAFGWFFALALVVYLTIIGVGIWAIINIVQWLTTK